MATVHVLTLLDAGTSIVLEAHGITCSRSRRGNRYDNDDVESRLPFQSVEHLPWAFVERMRCQCSRGKA